MNGRRLRELKRGIEKAPRNRRGRRQYGEKLRSAGRAYAEEQLAQGVSLKQLAQTLGLNAATLQNWLKSKNGRTRVVRPVQVVEEKRAVRLTAANTSGAVVILGGGIRIEGMSTDELIALARGLS